MEDTCYTEFWVNLFCNSYNLLGVLLIEILDKASKIRSVKLVGSSIHVAVSLILSLGRFDGAASIDPGIDTSFKMGNRG